MQAGHATALRALILGQEVAALATLHAGEPAVSMTPYAILAASGEFVLHVSRLAAHTRDLLQHPGVSLLITGERTADVPAQARPRASVAGTARTCSPDDAAYHHARAAYLARFPQSEPLFGFGDFSLVLVAPQSVRYVGGFAQAWTLPGAQLRSVLQAGGA